MALDLPGHGTTGPPAVLDAAGLPDWDALGTSVLAALDGVGRGGGAPQMVVGVGHSLGGAACVLAELQRPGTFARLLLHEPILMDPEPPSPGSGRGSPKSAMAARRRRDFDSPVAALAGWARRPFFATWDRRALEGYVGGCACSRPRHRRYHHLYGCLTPARLLGLWLGADIASGVQRVVPQAEQAG